MTSDHNPDDSDGTGGAKYQVTEMVGGDRYVLAEVEATGIDELDRLLIWFEAYKLLDKYRLYSRDDYFGDGFVGVFDTPEEAKDKMLSISYDTTPSDHFYIMKGDEVVFGEPSGVRYEA